jgi:hypothetical protein
MSFIQRIMNEQPRDNVDAFLHGTTILGSIWFVNQHLPLYGAMDFGALSTGVVFAGVNEIFRETAVTIYKKCRGQQHTNFLSGLFVSAGMLMVAAPLAQKIAPAIYSAPSSPSILQQPVQHVVHGTKDFLLEEVPAAWRRLSP